jgi:hypothetical protein
MGGAFSFSRVSANLVSLLNFHWKLSMKKAANPFKSLGEKKKF